MYKQLFLRRAEEGLMENRKLDENWNQQCFTSKDGMELTQRILGG